MPQATRYRLMRRRAAAALVIALVAIAALACDSWQWVEIVNGTDEAIMISYRARPNDRYIVEPGDSETRGWPIGTGMAFTVYDSSNIPLADFDLSWEELQATDFNVTITADQFTTSE